MDMLYFDEYGDNSRPAILLLHGAAALDVFCRQYCLAQKYYLIVPHLPGAGKAADRAYEPEKLTEELLKLIDRLPQKKVGVIGHSLGAQLAVRLVSVRPESFRFAVFLSAWVNPKPETVQMYCRWSAIMVEMLHWKWLVRLSGRYWQYTREQADFMAEYTKHITAKIYRSFFENTLDLQKLPAYFAVDIPMLAICAAGETQDMKTSLHLLGRNPHCRTMSLPAGGHDFPVRQAKQLNPILEKFIQDCT